MSWLDSGCGAAAGAGGLVEILAAANTVDRMPKQNDTAKASQIER